MKKPMLCQVAVSAAVYGIDKPYTYEIPAGAEGDLRPGMRVMVPFGKGSRRTEGIVLALSDQGEGGPWKPIDAVLDEEPVLDGEGLRLALWMRGRYFCTVYEAVKAMLPAGLYFSLKDSYSVAPGVDRERAYLAAGSSGAAKRLLDMLYANGGTMERGRIRDAFGLKDPGPGLKLLRDAGVLNLTTSASRGVGDKTALFASLAVPAEEALRHAAAGKARAPLRRSVVELLMQLGCAPAKEVCYYTGASMASLKTLEKHGILRLERQEVLRCPDFAAAGAAPPPQLNEEQQLAFDGIAPQLGAGKPGCGLLYGVTGSGKTQVYIALIHKLLAMGRSAIVLVPEIALTPQLLRIFSAHFGRLVAVLHSSLSAGARYDEWKRVRAGDARVVVGTRSAVFAPVRDLGLIIIDEEQEGSYKSENLPRYHARDVAKFRCVRAGGYLLLGSATPAVESMYEAETGVYQLYTLRRRYNARALPQVITVDMKEELRRGNDGTISALLRGELEANLERGEQSILFLNRRGTSRMAVCTQCGAVPECPRCSVKLTYHRANHRLMCHYCGHSRPLPDACPVCGGPLTFLGAGTQKVQEELEGLFPGVEVLRMDTDTVTAANTHEKILNRFAQKRVPILVGTQMVAKGLDFENVSLVGVISADLSLYVDDFRAGERTFSLLTQVVGRAGRGDKLGRAVIQTFTPENDVILCARDQDYDRFYRQEIALRRSRGQPPFCDRFVLTASGPEESAVLRACMRLRQGLEQWNGTVFRDDPFQILGPAAAGVVKVNNRYRYRLTVSGKNNEGTRQMIARILQAAHEDKMNRGVAVFADVNPMD